MEYDLDEEEIRALVLHNRERAMVLQSSKDLKGAYLAWSRMVELMGLLPEYVDQPKKETGPMTIEELELPVKIQNCLIYGGGIFTVPNLVQLSEAQLLALPNFGPKYLKVLKGKLGSMGMALKTT